MATTARPADRITQLERTVAQLQRQISGSDARQAIPPPDRTPRYHVETTGDRNSFDPAKPFVRVLRKDAGQFVDADPDQKISLDNIQQRATVPLYNDGQIWRDRFGEWWLESVDAGLIHYGKAASNWLMAQGQEDNAALSIRKYLHSVAVDICERDGTLRVDSKGNTMRIGVWFLHTQAQHPNVKQDQIIAYTYDREGVAICPFENDDMIGTVKCMVPSSNQDEVTVPQGWAVMNGVDNTYSKFDMNGNLVIGSGSSGGNDDITDYVEPAAAPPTGYGAMKLIFIERQATYP